MKKLLALSLLVFAVLLPGCLLVRTTEHRIHLNADGGGDALLRLIDIRSDAETDSLVAADFQELLDLERDSTAGGFETGTRRITEKQILVEGDTLIGEVKYDFLDAEEIEGLRVTRDELAVVVGPERVVVATNGKIEKQSDGGVRIVWARDATDLQYEIAERVVRPSTALAPMYREHMGRLHD